MLETGLETGGFGGVCFWRDRPYPSIRCGQPSKRFNSDLSPL
ncbi:hypothetical protein [Leptothermofonsia sp. ETS-13]